MNTNNTLLNPDDFADLDELLGEAKSLQDTIQAGKAASNKLRRGNLRIDEHEEALASIRAAEAITTWEDVAEIAVRQHNHCTGCGHETVIFIGYFGLRRHRRDKGAKQVVRLSAPTTPNPQVYSAIGFTKECGYCVGGAPLEDALVKEFTILSKFHDDSAEI